MSWDRLLSCALSIKWTPFGLATLDANGKVKFPKLPGKAGLYQFRIQGPKGDFGRYVGETDNLQRRFAHYRNPRPTQATNLRINALVKEVLSTGGTIEIAVVVNDASITRDGQKEMADLTEKNIRRLFENFVLVADRAYDIFDLNK